MQRFIIVMLMSCSVRAGARTDLLTTWRLQGAKFVRYQPDRGEWQFEVEHFSRYGLLDDSDDEGSPRLERQSRHDHIDGAKRLDSVAEGGSDDMQQGVLLTQLQGIPFSPLPTFLPMQPHGD